VAPVILGLAHGDFGYAKSLPFGEYRQESFLVPVKANFLQYLAPKRARAASQIAELQACDEPKESVECASTQGLEP